MRLRVFQQSILVLGDADVVLEFLDKRSSNTSSRLQTPSVALYVVLLDSKCHLSEARCQHGTDFVRIHALRRSMEEA